MKPSRINWSRRDDGIWEGRSRDGIVRAQITSPFYAESEVIWLIDGPEHPHPTYRSLNAAKASAQRAWGNWVWSLIEEEGW